MRKLLSNKLYLMLISVLIAFVLWVSVVSISNPDTTGSKAVNIEERNASVLTSAGKAYTIQGSKTVKVNYTVQARDAYKVKSSDFRAYIDLSDIYDESGNVRVVVQTVNNQDIISDCSSTPQTVQVLVEDIITKTVNVKVYTVDKASDGYEAAASQTTLTQVNITGPESLINSIAVAGVEVSVKDATGTLTGNAPLKFYASDDENARAVDVSGNKFFSASAYSTDYTLYMNTVKTVPIQYEVSGTPATGYHYSSSSTSIGSVIVTGNADLIAGISAITIPSSVLNVNGATSNRSWNVDLNTYLPNGVTITGTHQTQITAIIEPDTPSLYGGPGAQESTQAAVTTESSESQSEQTSGQSEESTAAESGPGTTKTEAEQESGSQPESEQHSQSQSHTSEAADEQTGTTADAASHEQTGDRNVTESQEQSEEIIETIAHGSSQTQPEERPQETSENIQP